ncbi:MAG: 1,4-dihydroxy-2-naphthoate octaprenyltransferase [Bacteroidales bacterium]|nr:1,4-dihydroxy-2-naphthoate octaprenyltransferase [Bacteroidales bacterium]
MTTTGKPTMLTTAGAIVRSMRLRTLPLSLAGVVLGSMMAWRNSSFNLGTAIFLYLTTVLLQILSNMSNETGDYINGTDRDDRQAPKYSLQSGTLTLPMMKRCIAATAVACCLSGTIMVWLACGSLWQPRALLLLALGAAAIWAAMHYTLGKNPYGYRGLGDIFVFLFFGLVSVMGGYYVAGLAVEPLMLLPASAIGLFSVGVLNTNNIRDMESDRATRLTVPLLIGERNAKIYHTFLISAGWLLLVVYALLTATHWWQWLFLLALPLHAVHLAGVWCRRAAALDPMLPLLVISTFLLALIMGTTYIL